MLDTKSKNNNKWLGNLLCVLLILVMAAGTLFCYPGIRQAAMKRMDDYRATSGITDGQKDTDDLVYTDEYGEWNYISYRTVLQEVGLPLLVVVVTVILGLAALLLPLIPSLEIGKGIFSRIPLEINFFLALSPIWTYLAMLDILSDFLFSGNSSNMLGNISYQISWLIQFGIWSLLYSFWFVAVLSFRSLVTLGPKRYFLERIWTVQFFRWFWRNTSGTVTRLGKWVYRKIRGFFRLCVVTLEDIDLTDPSDRMIFKILGLNAIILFVCFILGQFGIMALLLYTVVLFFLLKKYSRVVKANYQILLQSTRKLAEGDLEAVITENVGIFEPLKLELNRVQAGFQKAVEEDRKSQNMKSELITNVSHDLKTPLTAIITYINLLKDEKITEEERRKYIDILDRKSIRLKQLIEDLFEISKANSGNIKVEKKLLNLTERSPDNIFHKIPVLYPCMETVFRPQAGSDDPLLRQNRRFHPYSGADNSLPGKPLL